MKKRKILKVPYQPTYRKLICSSTHPNPKKSLMILYLTILLLLQTRLLSTLTSPTTSPLHLTRPGEHLLQLGNACLPSLSFWKSLCLCTTAHLPCRCVLPHLYNPNNVLLYSCVRIPNYFSLFSVLHAFVSECLKGMPSHAAFTREL